MQHWKLARTCDIALYEEAPCFIPPGVRCTLILLYAPALLSSGGSLSTFEAPINSSIPIGGVAEEVAFSPDGLFVYTARHTALEWDGVGGSPAAVYGIPAGEPLITVASFDKAFAAMTYVQGITSASITAPGSVSNGRHSFSSWLWLHLVNTLTAECAVLM